MKKTISAVLTALVLCIISISAVEAQSWSKVYTSSYDMSGFCETATGNIFYMREGKLLMKSSGKGVLNSWTQVTTVSGYPTTDYNALAAYQDNLYLVNFTNVLPYKGKGFFISTDQGLNWTKRNNGLGVDTVLASIKVMPNGNIFVSALLRVGGLDSYKIYRSADNGTTWTYVLTLNYDIFSLVQNSSGTYFLTEGSNIYSSTDSGSSWIKLQQSEGSSRGQMVVASNDSIYLYSNQGFIRSVDGVNWTKIISTGWPVNQSPAGYTITRHDTIYATVTGGGSSVYGVYMSGDLGKNWTTVNTGLPSARQINNYQFWLSPKTGYLFAGIYLSGVYRTTAPVSTPITTGILSPANYSDAYALTVSPNPAVQETHIEYTLPSADVVTIELLDQSGKVVKNILTNSSQPAGTHTMQLNVSGIRAGLYLLSVRSSSGASVKKVVVN